MKYVIIGNSAAAVGTAEGIRSIDKTGEIIMVTKEREHTYARPLISYLLQGKTTREKMKYRPDGFYKNNNIEFMFGEVINIDPWRKELRLNDGKSISYDKLMVASGSRPFVPPMEGLDTVAKRSGFMTVNDAEFLMREVGEDTKVLILGAGLIGLKCAEGLCGRARSITVVDLAGRVLPSILTPEASEIVRAHIKKSGINFILGDSVARFEKDAAYLKSGKELPFDVLVVAVGVRPNVELVKDAGGTVGRGVLTNAFMETTLPGVYSAGDCTESYDVSADGNRVLAILPNAYIQGECAGINMAGGKKEFKDAIPMNAIGFFGLHMITAGSYDGDAAVTRPESGEGYKQLYIKDGLLKGFILIGDVKRAGIYTSIIKDKIPLSGLDFDLLVDKPQLIAFSKEYRREKLGGAVNAD
ncbi:MAG: FAD-dependent oxidoreductase [Bacillota bacterium]|nr:FAD-dependent oxidoreductase [Bacillota bacterium]